MVKQPEAVRSSAIIEQLGLAAARCDELSCNENEPSIELVVHANGLQMRGHFKERQKRATILWSDIEAHNRGVLIADAIEALRVSLTRSLTK